MAGVQAIEKVEIMAQEKEEVTETLSKTEIEEIQIYFSQTYAVEKEKIEIS